MAAAIAAYLHFLSIFGLFALLSIEHVLFKRPLDLQRAKTLIITDLAYGLCAALVLITGAARVLWFGKGWEYYLYNGVFHIKLGLFLLVGLLSILPTFVFINWRNSVNAGEVPEVSERKGKLVIMTIRLELLILLILPLLASLMARGFGAGA